MDTSRGHFDLNHPDALYQKAVHNYLEFIDSPDSWRLFDLLTTFNHLLEWICPEANGKTPPQAYFAGTRQQQFYYELWNRSDYKQIRALCNNSKHFTHKLNGPTTSVVVGAELGLLRAGNHLGQTYFLVDGEDIRGVIMNVYCSFKQYFESGSDKEIAIE